MDAKTKAVRYSREVESGLKQWQKYANPEQNPVEYRARYDFAFWTQERQDHCLALMAAGDDFMTAYEATRLAFA